MGPSNWQAIKEIPNWPQEVDNMVVMETNASVSK